ncbi:murein L,D-transpeptidase catalytic domain family protein [uncultured Fusobacterium sp.]|uniref:murein L,D-transpeptidase catalytic domain family protein n=1 Tax=uncultured Fusobacterium sp. TaxID=159267 RepID=UPI0025F85259|nr:murein L,D-transpeptidase catalytic domain family protein [uncultured Fusobacterium sp.]
MLKKIVLGLTLLSSLTFGIDLQTEDKIKGVYKELGIENKLNYSTFFKAIQGYNKIDGKKEGYITIIDFSKPSNEERFFVIDLENKKVNYSTYVSHGKNTGLDTAVKFSNKMNSYQSSLGFYLTINTYEGSNGYSLRLKGLEPGINSNAMDRHIVVHGADYATKEFMEKYGFLGRSLGCPAIPEDISKEVIDYIKGGTVLYINGNDESYFEKSQYISLKI